MVITVIYPKQAAFTLTVPVEKQGGDMEAVNWAWDACQHVCEEHDVEEFTRLNVRSSCVGDLFLVFGNYYLCEPSGWRKCTVREALRWQRLDQVDQIFGWKWCENKGLITPDVIELDTVTK